MTAKPILILADGAARQTFFDVRDLAERLHDVRLAEFVRHPRFSKVRLSPTTLTAVEDHGPALAVHMLDPETDGCHLIAFTRNVPQPALAQALDLLARTNAPIQHGVAA